MPEIKPLLKDPLTHFLAIGAVFFVIASAINPPEPEEKRIVVDRAALLEFIQYRSKAFEPKAAAAMLDAMSPAERDDLARAYVEEEAVYREAKAIGLEADDYVIKQRLIQKFDFLAESAAAGAEPSNEDIAAYYAAHKQDYYIQPSATFTHVFFSAGSRGGEAAKNAASEMARRLQADSARFEDAVGKGDRFPFHTNYVERTYDYVASQFGEEAAKAIFDEKGPFGVWRAPVMSVYGAHAVFVSKLAPGRYPALAEIEDKVTEDARRDIEAKIRSRILEDLIARYDVVVDLPKGASASAAASAGAGE
jgi:hypothetical protein